jgi:hypothetical protein
MHADQAKTLAAVRPSHFASTALAATNIWLDGAAVSGLQAPIILRNFYNLACKLVTENARVSVDGVPSSHSVKIAPTNPDPIHSNQSFSTGGHRARRFDLNKLARSIQQNFSHKRNSSDRGLNKNRLTNWFNHHAEPNCMSTFYFRQGATGQFICQ